MKIFVRAIFSTLLCGAVAAMGDSPGSTSNAGTTQPPVPPESPKENGTGDPVGEISGNVYDSVIDITVPCPDIDIVFRRSYGSWSTRTGALGYGWTHSYEWSVGSPRDLPETGSKAPKVVVYASGETGPTDAVHIFPALEKGQGAHNADGYELFRSGDGRYTLTTPTAVSYAFDIAGRLSTVATWNGTRIILERDAASGRLIRVVHDNGKALCFTYDETGKLVRVDTPDPDVWLTFGYVSIGDNRLLSSVVRHCRDKESSMHYVYNEWPRPGRDLPAYWVLMLPTCHNEGFLSSAPLLTRKQDANGLSTIFMYRRLDDGPTAKCEYTAMDGELFGTFLDYNERKLKLELGKTDLRFHHAGGEGHTVVEYDNYRREVSRRTYAEVITRNYSNNGDIIAERKSNTQTGAYIETTKTYDNNHRMASVGVAYCSTPSHFTSVQWNEQRGIPCRIESPEGRVREWGEASGVDTVYGAGHYDDRMITYIHNMTNYHPYAIISPDGGRTDFTYDGEGYISRIDADDMPYISMTRDLLGHVNSITRPGPDGARTTSITNNWRGKPLSIDYPDGTSETFAYNGNGTRVVRHIDALGREDAYEWVLGLQVHAGRVIEGVTNTLFGVDYDQQLNVVAITDPLGRSAETYVLDQNERIVGVTNVEGQNMSRSYAVGDFVSSETRFDGSQVSYSYNNDGNLSAVAYPDGTLAFTYDADGLRTSAANGEGLVTNTYDAATGWLDSTRGVDGTEVAYSRSKGGAVTSVVSVAGTSAYVRDRANRLSRMVAPSSTFSFGYCDWNGKVSAVTNGNGLVTTYAYDIMDRVTNIAWMAADGTPIGGFAYSYDAIGRIVSRNYTLGNPSQPSPMSQLSQKTYTYDDLDRLAADGDVAYTYDAAGNRLAMTDASGTTTYTLGTGDRLAAWTGGSYSYNAAGCVTQIAHGGDTLDLAWNSQYQLVSVSTNGAFAESYTYDALGRRVSTTTLEGTIRHVYDGVQCIADIDENNVVVASYTWGAGIDNLLAIHIGGATYYPLTDVQGTVWGYADANNNIVACFSYDAWGNILSSTSSVPALVTNRYRFQCREWSVVTGLVNFRARWYDPVTGRWLSKDPIGISGGLNLYAFCGNDPIDYSDFNGLDVHYSACGGTGDSSGGGHSVVWVDDPDSKKKGRTVIFEFGPASGNVLGGPSEVVVNTWNGHKGSDVSVSTTPEQDAAAIHKANEIKSGRPSYWYPFRNCADAARDVLNAAGLDLPSRLIDTPGKLLNDINERQGR